MPRAPRLLTLAALAGALALGLLVSPHPGLAQQPQATISGAITLGTPGDTLPAGIELQLIVLEESLAPTSIRQQADANGTFTFEVDPDPRFNYVPFLIYEGVRYFSTPSSIRFDGTTSSATAAFEVYSTTTEAPDLSIEATTVIAVALERSTSTLTLIREDLINRDELTVYVGGDDAVTLRIPVPDRTIDAGGLEDDDPDFSFEGGTVNVSLPLRPGPNSIVTRYTVGYDAVEDMYRLRITSPLPTGHIEARAPESFVNKLDPRGDDARRAADTEFEGDPILVVERIGPATPGQSLVVDLIGLSGARPAHILTTPRGAVSGSLLALIVISGLAVALARRATPADDAEAPA
ncbi:MAG: hypothetical protein HOH95_03825 [Dehalococcoidia bacterium]|jgi:hypothetical protein|nr:hypothetical protein [Dehalococcoidia bacterium]